MAIYTVTEDELTNTADAIRQKAGTTAELEWEQGNGFKEVIEAIPSGDTLTIDEMSGAVILPYRGSMNTTLELTELMVSAVSGELV